MTLAMRICAALGLLLVAFMPLADAQRDAEMRERERSVIQMAEEILPQVAELRGLDWKFTPRTGITTREELQEDLLAELESEESKEEYRRTALVLHKLGLVEHDFDMLAEVTEMYTQGVGGYYDPRTRTLNLVVNPEMSTEMELQDRMLRMQFGYGNDEMIIAHELTHALDDQHFDLLNLVDTEQLSTDEMLARTATVEITAVTMQYDFLLQRTGQLSYEHPLIRQTFEGRPGSSMLPGDTNLPESVIQTFTFPYAMGNRLGIEARRRDDGGWDTVNKMFEDLPASTSQIIHPEKYLDERVDPVVLAFPENYEEKLGEGWQEIDRDTLGQFFMWCYFEEMFANRRSIHALAQESTEGWMGDRIAVFEKPKSEKLAMVWASTWESESDSRQFFRLYRNLLQKKYGDAAPQEGDSTLRYAFADSEDTVCMLVRDGKDVVVLESVPKDSAERVLEAALQCERREWERAPRTNLVPDVPPVPNEPAIQSPYFDNLRYDRGEESAWRFELPRAGFELIQEGDEVIALRAPEEERKQTVRVRTLEGSFEQFAEEETREEAVESLRGQYGEPRVISQGKLERPGGEIYRVALGGRDFFSARDRIVVAAWFERDGQLYKVTVAAAPTAISQVARDVNALVSAIREEGRD